MAPNGERPASSTADIRTRSPKRRKLVDGAPPSSVSIARRSAMQVDPVVA